MTCITFRFMDIDCVLIRKQYHTNKRHALLVEAADTPFNRDQGQMPGEPVAKASVNVDIELAHDEVAIKSWAENEGMLETLIAAGFVEDLCHPVPCGYEFADVVRLIGDSNGELE